MDDFTDVPEVQRGERDVSDLRPTAAGTVVGPDDLKELKLADREQIDRLVKLYSELEFPQQDAWTFAQHLMFRRDSWFVEAGDVGLYYFTDIVPRASGMFHMVFWDKRLTADRREAAKIVLSTAFQLFDLRRISAVAVETNVPLRKTLQKTGFTAEGVLRKAYRRGDEYLDLCLFGLLSEETTWPLLTTSLGR